MPEGFQVAKLWLQDRFYLLLEIRKATKGSKYSFQTTCPSCGSQSQQNISLGSLPVVRLDTKPKAPIAKKTGKLKEVKEDVASTMIADDWNIIEIDKNVSIRIVFVTREMQRTAMDRISAMKDLSDTQKAVELSTTLFALAIQEIITPGGIDTDLTLEDKLFFIDNVSQDSLEKISKWYEDHDFGIKFSFTTECRSCKMTDKREIPLESFFF
jgi:hypothetical protein